MAQFLLFGVDQKFFGNERNGRAVIENSRGNNGLCARRKYILHQSRFRENEVIILSSVMSSLLGKRLKYTTHGYVPSPHVPTHLTAEGEEKVSRRKHTLACTE